MKRMRLLLTLAVAVVCATATAAPRTKEQMKQAAVQAINEQLIKKRMAPKKANELQTLRTENGLEVMGFAGKGFAVVSKDDVAPEVLGVSGATYNDENTNFQWWLKAMNQVVETAVANNNHLVPIAPDPSKYPVALAPLMTTLWDQLEPYNRFCPISNGGDRCYTGCVATALAQVLNYHKTPEHGYGQRTIYYHSTAVSADFENTYYDWDNMLDEYNYGGYSDTEATAVATLMRDCGVAANMEYGGSAEAGSGAYSQDAAEGMATYFGFADARCVERDNYYTGTKLYTDAEWMDMVFNELNENGPIYYGGADSWQGGHAFVIHGYDATGKVYVNWGWSGDDDGYYDISLLNPSYYQFSSGQDMILGIKGAPKDLVSKELTLTEAGTLSLEITDEMTGSIGSLKVSGDINASDIRQIRRLAGIDEYGENTDGNLTSLDLSEAHIVEGGSAYLIEGSKRLTTTNDELPTKAFYGCRKLRTVKLPAGLKSYGDGALALCPQLSTIEIGAPAEDATFVIDEETVWNTDKTEIIAVLPTKSGEYVISSTATALHDYALAGCSRLSKITIPSNILTIGKEALRSCGAMQEIRVTKKEPPTLTGADVFTGINVYNCKLYVPSGSKAKYAQKAQWSNFKGDDFDNIVEYGSSVKVRNTIRLYGEENPTFTYTVNGDQINGVPELTCEATPESPAGRYPITISMGTITDDAVTLIDGYLVVQKRSDVAVTGTVDNATREEGEENPEFTISYSEGLLFNQIAPVWLTAPVITTTATIDSPAGEYPITVELDGAVAESYELSVFTFVPGVLTITAKEEPTTGILTINTQHPTPNTPIYNLAGQRVGNGYKGIVIVNGKKTAIR